MEACAILGCRQLIFHPVLYLHRMPDRSLWPRIHDWNVRWFHELLPLAEKFDIVINLENTFDYRHLQQPGDAPVPYTTAQDMLELVYGIGSNLSLIHISLCAILIAESLHDLLIADHLVDDAGPVSYTHLADIVVPK